MTRPGSYVDLESATVSVGRFDDRRATAAKDGRDARRQLFDVERLDDVVVPLRH